MANSLVRIKCGVCGKVAKERSRTPLHRIVREEWEREEHEMAHLTIQCIDGKSTKEPPGKVFTCNVGEIYAVVINLECGHGIERPIERADESVEIISSDGRVPYDFQWHTCQFIESAGLEGLILHEQGLGKTVISCMLLKRNHQHMLPCIYVCKSGLMQQVFGEIVRWTGMVPQMITSSRELPSPDWFEITLVSIDMLRLVRPDIANQATTDTPDHLLTKRQRIQRDKQKNPRWSDELLGRYKTIIMDESQKIKNPESSRTQAFRKIVKLGNSGKKAKVICLSGTNIEKHAGEYFVTLNVVRPELFPNQHQYEYEWCETNDISGKIMGLRNPKKFKELTKDFIIRYRREQVLPDLPPVVRQFKRAELESDDVLKEYLKVVAEYQEYMLDEERKKTPTDILGYMQKMRHWTGMAKVPHAVDHIEEFLLETDDDRKLVVFTEHKDVAAKLVQKVSEVCRTLGYREPLHYHSGLNLSGRTACIEEFKKPENRIMIAGEKIAGEGLNLQFCSDCLMVERQFNPSLEEQAEGRFPRPGRGAEMPNKINAVYLIAIGTIDDFLTSLVEEKRANVRRTLDYENVKWDEASLMHELAQALAERGLRHWSL